MSRGVMAMMAIGLLTACTGYRSPVRVWDPDSPVLPDIRKAQVETAADSSGPKLRQYVVLLPDEDGGVGAVDVSRGEAKASLDRAYQGVSFDNLSETYQVDPREFDGLAGVAEVLAHEPAPPANFTVYFELSSAGLTAESRAAMEAILASVTSRGAPRLWVAGHADRSGSTPRNDRLSRQRAEAVRDMFLEAGVEAEVIEVQWHGENRLAVTTGDGVREPLNRRAVIHVR